MEHGLDANDGQGGHLPVDQPQPGLQRHHIGNLQQEDAGLQLRQQSKGNKQGQLGGPKQEGGHQGHEVVDPRIVLLKHMYQAQGDVKEEGHGYLRGRPPKLGHKTVKSALEPVPTATPCGFTTTPTT